MNGNDWCVSEIILFSVPRKQSVHNLKWLLETNKFRLANCSVYCTENQGCVQGVQKSQDGEALPIYMNIVHVLHVKTAIFRAVMGWVEND